MTNRIAGDARGRIYIALSDGTLRSSSGRDGSSKSTVIITPSPALEFKPKHICISRNGLYAALAEGAHAGAPTSDETTAIALVDLTHAVAAAASGGGAAQDDKPLTVTCPQTSVAGDRLNSGSSTEILQMAWHPHSDTHLAVLLRVHSDTCFCLYNVAVNPDYPESEHVLRPGPDAPRGSSGALPTCFSFAPADQWGYFTVLFASAGGGLSALCPLAPFGARYPTAVIKALISTDRADDPHGPGQERENLAWVAGSFELPGHSAAAAAAALGARGPSAAVVPFALEGITPCLQDLGRLAGPPGGGADAGARWGRLCAFRGSRLAGAATLLAAATAEGGVAVQLLMEDVQPLWAAASHPQVLHDPSTGAVLAAVFRVPVLPRAALAPPEDDSQDPPPALLPMDFALLGPGGGGQLPGAEAPLVMWTDDQPPQLVASWGSEVVAVRIPWVLPMTHMLSERGLEEALEEEGEAKWEFEAASVDRLMPPAAGVTIEGVFLHTRPLSGTQAAVLTSQGTCHTLEVSPSAHRSHGPAASDSGAGSGSTGAAEEDASVSGVAELVRQPGKWVPPKQVEGGPAAAAGDAAVERYRNGLVLVQASTGLWQHYVRYAHRCHSELAHRALYLGGEVHRQQVQAASLREDLPDLRERSQRLLHRIQEAHQRHEAMEARMAKLSELLRQHPQKLSAAELSLYSTLQVQQDDIPAMREQMANLTARAGELCGGGRAVASPAPAASPSRHAGATPSPLRGPLRGAPPGSPRSPAPALMDEQVRKMREALAGGMRLMEENSKMVDMLNKGVSSLQLHG